MRPALLCVFMWVLLMVGMIFNNQTKYPDDSVRVEKTKYGYSLYRGNSPYFVKGACVWGENSRLMELKQSGANSVRTYSSQYAEWTLNAAQELKMTVMLGYEINSVNWGGTNYLDQEQVKYQREKFKKFVLKHKDHPALLLYAIGNEVEHSAEKTEQWEAMWRELNYLAQMVKLLDPQHPTSIVLAGAKKDKLDAIKKWCPDIDLICINAYSEARNLKQYFQDNNWNRPYLVTEFGWRGWWEGEMFNEQSKIPIEITSTQKAIEFEKDYKEIVKDKNCLGSYIFYWHHKIEGTSTWFGMFLNSGERLETINAMAKVWKGRIEPYPKLNNINTERKNYSTFEPITINFEKVNGKLGGVEWKLEKIKELTPENAYDAPNYQKLNIISDNKINSITIQIDKPGIYRLYCYVFDGLGKAATGNVIFSVK